MTGVSASDRAGVRASAWVRVAARGKFKARARAGVRSRAIASGTGAVGVCGMDEGYPRIRVLPAKNTMGLGCCLQRTPWD